MGLVAHGMQGFDQALARQQLEVPDAYDLPALIAVGAPGDTDLLPADDRDREKPSGRLPLADICFTDNFRELAS